METVETKEKTRRERIDAVLTTMGAAVEEISFNIDFLFPSDYLQVHLVSTERRYLDAIAAAHGVEITEEPSGSDFWPVKRSAVIDGVTFLHLCEAEEEAGNAQS